MKIKIRSLIVLCLLSAGFLSAQVVYTGKPMYNILVKRAGIPIGSFTVELFPNLAPHHVRNFDSLVAHHFYDTTAFHRVIPGFVIQGGDPNSRHGAVSTWGYGQPGQLNVNAEFSKAKHVRGILSAARSSNINSATSQFFICVAPAPNLDGQYSIYGRTTAGMNIVDTIVLASTSSNTVNRPNLKHEMFVTYIGSNDTVPDAPIQLTPRPDSASSDMATAMTLKWKSVHDAVTYHLDISDNPSYTDTIVSVDTPDLSYTSSGNLFIDTWYYWRVRANNGGHFSNWSPTWKFHMGRETGILTNNKSATGTLVFPNPGAGSFYFSNIAGGSSLQVFDAGGRLVYETLVNEKTTLVNLAAQGKGCYNYRTLLKGKETSSGTIILN